ncbi:MAG: ATP-binding protein, partial [Acidobacteriota bacterium]
LPTPLQADPTRLRQILVNLLANAIKFTERGHIHVRLEWRRETSSLRLEVEDTGIGIPEAAVDRLFSPFQQVDSSTSRRFGGTGLGLAICKSLAELMGGEIGVRSRRGQGSTFWLDLPLTESTPGRPQPPPSTRPGELTGRRLLVVEDDEVNRMVTVARLESLGAVVTTSADGRDALERLSSERFDLVLMDCQIPELDGYQTTERLRATDGPNKTVPVVALTAHAHPDERSRCLEAGMNDFLSKPVETDELYATLRDWLDIADSLREPSGVITVGDRFSRGPGGGGRP